MSAEGELPLARRSVKSESAFRTISEVSEELDVPQHVLRFWESKFPQVKPLKRGGGRRYYRPEDVALLRRIRDLLYSEGYTIKGVQKLLREGGHKEGATPKAEPELQLPMGDEDDEPGNAPDMDDGEEGGEVIAEDADDVPPFAIAQPQPQPEVVIAAPKEPEIIPQLQPQSPPQVAAEPGLPPVLRRELEQVLEELEQLRGLLQPR